MYKGESLKDWRTLHRHAKDVSLQGANWGVLTICSLCFDDVVIVWMKDSKHRILIDLDKMMEMAVAN